MEQHELSDLNRAINDRYIFGSWKNRKVQKPRQTGVVEPIISRSDEKKPFVMPSTPSEDLSGNVNSIDSINHCSYYNCDYELPNDYENHSSRYDQLDEYFWCPRCGGRMHDPRLLPCLHTVCYDCVKEFMNENFLDDSSAINHDDCTEQKLKQCPICDHPLPKAGTEVPPPHYSLQHRLLLYALQKRLSYRTVCCDTCPNEMQATLHCSKCLCNFCVDCAMEHEEMYIKFRKNLDGHKVRPIWEATKLRRVAVCPSHPTHPLRFHCIACQQVTCRECVWRGVHRGHASEDASSASKRVITEMTRVLKSAKILLSSLLVKYNDKIFMSNTISRSYIVRPKRDKNHNEESSRITHFRSYSEDSSYSKEARERIQEFSRLKRARYLIDAIALCEDLLSNGTEIEILNLSQTILKRFRTLGVPRETKRSASKSRRQFITPAHAGIFHCCTFCSSGGKKEVACACNGTMPGGYKGCGHGHHGHPGLPHWSCCGSVSREGYCLAAQKFSYQMTL